jgi:hypothetical protein
VSQFRYLETTVTNQNLIQDEIKYHSLQNPLSSRLLSKNYSIENYNFSCVSVWEWTWSLTIREEHRLRMFEKKVQMRILDQGGMR